MQKIIFSKNITAELDALCDQLAADRVFLLTDVMFFEKIIFCI